MDCAVVYSERSLSDLHDITAFIAADNAEAAVTFANRLLNLAESLRRPPGQELEECPRRCTRAIFDFLSLRAKHQPCGRAAFLARSSGPGRFGNVIPDN